MGNEQTLTYKPGVYHCAITESVAIACGYFSIAVPPGEMLAIADFVLTHRIRLEQSQRELDEQHLALIQEIKMYCGAHETAFSTLSDWDITNLMRELGGCTTANSEEWEPIDQLSPAGRWYRTVCCDETGGVYFHIWKPFYAVLQQWQQREEEKEAIQAVS